MRARLSAALDLSVARLCATETISAFTASLGPTASSREARATPALSRMCFCRASPTITGIFRVRHSSMFGFAGSDSITTTFV